MKDFFHDIYQSCLVGYTEFRNFLFDLRYEKELIRFNSIKIRKQQRVNELKYKKHFQNNGPSKRDVIDTYVVSESTPLWVDILNNKYKNVVPIHPKFYIKRNENS